MWQSGHVVAQEEVAAIEVLAADRCVVDPVIASQRQTSKGAHVRVADDEESRLRRGL